MASGDEQSDGGLMPGLLAGFGYFPPSLLVPYFRFRRVDVVGFLSTPTTPQLPADANRWALFLPLIFTGTILGNVVAPALDTDSMIGSSAAGHVLLTFADIGSLITQPWHIWCASSGTGYVYDISYSPQRCP